MKKILASCLTTLALLGSVCFSSPPAQVHATETSTEQSSSTAPIDLNVYETVTGYRHFITTDLELGDIIKIKDMNKNIGYYGNEGGSVNITLENLEEGTFKVTRTMPNKDFAFVLTNIMENKDYVIRGKIAEPIPTAQTSEGDNKNVVEIDLSQTSEYKAKMGETEESEDITTSVSVSSILQLSVDKTTKTLPAGSSFELKIPEKIATKYETEYNFKNCINTIDELKINGESIDHDQYSDYIKEIDPQNPWKISLLPTIKAGDKVSFKAYSIKKESPTPKSAKSENALVTYQAQLPEEEEYPQLLYASSHEYPFPVELTIVDEEKGDPVDDGDKDENINNKEDETKDEINSEKEPSPSKDETSIGEEKSSDKESVSTALKTGDNNSAVIFAAFAIIISGMLMIVLCTKKTIKK